MMKRIRNFYGVEEGFSYIEVRPRPRSRRRKESGSFSCGLGIIGGFLLTMLAFIIVM